MDAVKRIAKTCGCYDEVWSNDGKLSIAYHDERSYQLSFDGQNWSVLDAADKNTCTYLICSAAINYAVEKCKSSGLSLEFVHEFLPKECKTPIPAELLRVLLDDCGLGIFDACAIVVRCFGSDSAAPEIPWLHDVQPRTANLQAVLNNALKSFGFAVHDAYDEAYRSPLGAVEDGSEVKLCIHCFGGVKSAALCVYADGYSAEYDMQRDGDCFSCSFTPEKPAALWYRFKLCTESGERRLCAGNDGHFSVLSDAANDGFRLTVYKRGFTTPEWFAGRIMYQIFPDRFCKSGKPHENVPTDRIMRDDWYATPYYKPDEKGIVRNNDYFGGDLQGIIEKLPYIKSLGTTVIYLNPIFEAASNHRYNTADYRAVDPMLGTEEDFRELCRQAHKRGMRLLLDGVFNHTGSVSRYFNRDGFYPELGAAQSQASPYYNWYHFTRWPEEYDAWWGIKTLPAVDEGQDSYRAFIIRDRDSVVRRWLRAGADGWRLDVADELPDDVLRDLRTAAKQTDPDSVLLGEVWEDAVTKVSYGARRQYALGDALDSVMNYPFRTAILDFMRGRDSGGKLRDTVMTIVENYPPQVVACNMNLLGTHDTPRILTALVDDFDGSREEKAARNLKNAI